MQTLIERPADSAGAILSGLAVQQRERETTLQRLRRLRKEASAEIERLIAFLDASDDLEQDLAESGIADLDGLLEQVGTQDWQQGAMA